MPPAIVKNTPMPLHRHPEARLVLITSGQIEESELSGTKIYRAGDFFLRPPFFVHSNAEDDSARYVRLRISPRRWRALLSNSGWASHRGHVDLSESELKSLLRSKDGGDQLLEGVRPQQVTKGGAPNVDDLDALAEQLRDDEQRSGLKLGQVAKELNLATYQLTRSFARRYGVTPVGYKKEARLESAMRKMIESNDSLSVIASDVGYADQSHLSREILQTTGMTPAELRRYITGCLQNCSRRQN